MFFSDEINIKSKIDIEEIRAFLEGFGVTYDFPQKTFVIREKGKIISSGSADNNILKYFFTDPAYKGEGTISLIYNSLLRYLLESGFHSYFVFTNPKNKKIFESLGLKVVYNTEDVSLLEGGFYNYSKWIEKIKKDLKTKKGKRGAIVMNCNPLTLGHKYLIEKAMERVDNLLIFLVQEDRSIFPFNDRWNILKEEFGQDERIDLIGSGPYIISSVTFPTYFLKEEDDKLDIYTKLDAGIFAGKIAKDLQVDIRFLGTEPFDRLTQAYNKNLKIILDKAGIDLEIIDRKKIDDKIISASKIRGLLKGNRESEAFSLLPQSTIKFLKSEKGLDIIGKMKKL